MSEADMAPDVSGLESVGTNGGRKDWVAPAMGPMGEATARALGAVPSASHAGTDRESLVAEAVAEWTRRLVNLDGRNRMLYFRELRRGTLEITPTRRGVKASGVDKLLAEGAAELSELFEPDALSDAALRTLALAAKARTNFEEKGLATLYVGHSFASWRRSDGHTPRAPVVMIPVRIRLESAGGHDAVIELRGAAEPNPSLGHALRADIGRDPYPEAEERPSDFKDWLPIITQACADLDGFEIDDRLFLANLEFSKLPMVNDMEQHLDLLVGNDVVAAIAGDQEARSSINLGIELDEDLPDHTPPEEDFLVCDADASQNLALNVAMEGQSIVIHGPPGTGKSQTIANLISSLSARGKSVLFVAEKRAAIGAVTRRLDEAGCGELVLDLHDGSSRRQVVKSLDESIRSIGPNAGHNVVAPHADLRSTRKRLAGHRAQMHRPREPHGLSFFQLQAMVGTPDHEITGVRIPSDVLAKWTEEGRAEVRALLARWNVLMDRVEDDESGLWATSLIRSEEDAEDVRDNAQRLQARFIPAVDDAYRSALASLRLPAKLDIPIDEFAPLIADIESLAERYRPQFFGVADWLTKALAPAKRSRFGRLLASAFNGSYRNAKRQLADLVRGGPVDAVTALSDAQLIEKHRAQWKTWLGAEPMPTKAPGAGALTVALSEYRAARSVVEQMVPALAATGDFDTERAVVLELCDRLDLADARAELAITEAAITDYGLGPLVRDTTREGRAANDIADMAMRVFAASAIDAITWLEPELAMFNGRTHEKTAQGFAKLDRRQLEATSPLVMKRVAERAALVMKQRPREAALLRHEVETGAHNMPIRQLLGSMTSVAQALRPCWAMSPLLVSRMLPARPEMFDVVIFDEGSQVLPIHAIPAIARAPQVIVAGDPHQLPPAEQFQASESLEDEADDEHHDAATDAESILDVMRGLVPEHRLMWHYRSQDERLINFSNANIYDRSLVTFPGTKQGTGIRHVLADGVPKHAEGTSSNPNVVKRVVELILHHARQKPDESLGVIALGKRHATDISRALRIARLESDIEFGGFFEEKGAEPFFVKVMSDAQGDERDHIIVSIGYGPKPDGDLIYRWGALNMRGGHRRLNVAVTRSKRRMTVVSAITSDDIDENRTKSRGMDLLRQFIAYAENGGESMPGPDTGPLTAFEQSVLERLTRAQIPVEPHYGGGRHRIDFAAMDPRFANQPVLAIETDGLGYNSSATARDRDRLRLEVLAKRGWRHHRIWSIDWYRDPDGETARVKEAWVAAVSATDERRIAPKAGDEGERPVVAGRGRSPVAIRRIGILGYERDELVRLVKWIKSDGVQRNEEELIDEAVEVLGLTSQARNHRADRALRGAIAEAHALD